MTQAQLAHKPANLAESVSSRPHAGGHRTNARAGGLLPVEDLASAAFAADRGIPKSDATKLFQKLAAFSTVPLGRMRAELIPDSSWKRAGKTLGPQASQTAARLSHILSFADRVWGNEADAAQWLSRPHLELRGATPFSMLKSEAGGRAVEALLAALEFGFSV